MRSKTINYSEYGPILNRKSVNDLTGRTFGKLTVTKPIGIKNRYLYWECECICGNKVAVRGSHLVCGDTISCGCAIYAPNKTHGQSRTRLGREYISMMNRCYNVNHRYYYNYGGRGIKVCEEWKDNKIDFFKWAIANGYNDNLTIDRIDNEGNYEPLNCRWVNNIFQQNHKRNNKLITYNGETHTQAEWSRKTGITSNAIGLRLCNGWSLEKTLTTPLRKVGK